MGSVTDFQNLDVIQELHRWGSWFVDTTKIDGFRMDAVKHIHFGFYKNWLEKLRKDTGKELFSVGEYWSGDINKLIHYMQVDDYMMSLFDVPLHYHFYDASRSNGHYDMSKLLDGTLVSYDEFKAVTFVDNHDTQIGQSLESWVLDWFKPMAYAMILLRQQGYPCIFYGDYYGIPHNQISGLRDTLDILLYLRKNLAYGIQHDYFDDPHVVGFTRSGDAKHTGGLAVLLSDQMGGQKKMCIDTTYAHVCYRDCLHPEKDSVILDENGCGNFLVDSGSLSIYIPDTDGFFDKKPV